MRKVFLGDLPRKEGIGNNKNKKVIDWGNCINKSVEFEFDDIKGRIDILDYDKGKVLLRYKDNTKYINCGHFKNCKITSLIGFRSCSYIYNIGDKFNDKKRNLILLDNKTEVQLRKNGYPEYIRYYKYKCNMCGYDEGWLREGVVKRGGGCTCCAGKIVVEGINDIPTTAPWMVKYFQGGYDEAKKYTKTSRQKIHPICPNCGGVSGKKHSIADIYTNKSIRCICSSRTSFPEKLMYEIIKELNIEFDYRVNKRTLNWCESKEYDFYIPSLNMIIETHGIQHYEESFVGIDGARTLKEEQKNDKYKKELALKNGISEYIEIDCRISKVEWIRESILNSKLSELLDLSKINWEKCEENALENKNFEIWDYVNRNSNLSSSQIGEVFGFNRKRIRKIINKGIELGLCCDVSRVKYKEKELKYKDIVVYKSYKEDEFIYECNNLNDMVYYFMNTLGIKLNRQGISNAINLNKKYKDVVFQKELTTIEIKNN